MDKEEAKKEFDRWFNPDDFPSRNLVVYEVSQLIDAIEPEHKKVVLPKAVGEQWDTLVDHYASDQAVTDKCSAINHAMRWLPNRCSVGLDCGDLLYWWANTRDSYTKLADAARYGWIPERVKSWNVFVPKAIKIPGHVSIYAKFKNGVQPVNTDGPISAGEYTFTEEELIKYGLDSDLFEKVLVKDTK